MRDGGEQELGVRLKGVETLGEGHWMKALEWRGGPLTAIHSVLSNICQGCGIHSLLVTYRINYSYCIKVYLCSAGLYMMVIKLLLPLHPAC